MVRAVVTKGWVSSEGSVLTDLSESLKRCELVNGSFLPPYLQVYYSNLKLQGPVTPKGVVQPLWSGSLVAGRGKAGAISLQKGI